jgi:serine O-acetyltransferase
VSLWREIRRDLEIQCDGSLFERLNNRGFHSLVAYRLARWLWLARIPLAGQMLTRFVQILYGVDIHWRARLAPGTTIFHGMGLVIAPGTVIGEECVLYHGVTIGAIDHHKRARVPIIGNRVVVYTGAKVLGPITIGDDVVIGANAVVLTDVPANSIAVGIPARVRAKRDGNAVPEPAEHRAYASPERAARNGRGSVRD